MLICPNCKILYEKSTNCIKCGSPLVEKDSFKEEEAKPPSQPEVNKETPPAEIKKERPPVQKPAPSPIPPPKVKKEKAETESMLDMGKAIHEVMDDEQGPPETVPGKPKREVNRSDIIQIRIPDFSKFSYQRVGIIIVILIGGYLLWSIYSHLSTKKPDTSGPVSEEVSNLPPAKSSTHTKPLEPPAERKIAVKQPEEKSSIPEEKPAVTPSSPPSIPVASKASLPETSLSDKKEVENIENIFENIRKANLRKDVDLFMSCYSKSFKDRERKKSGVLKNWENFNYIDLSYEVRKLLISGDIAVVRIEWVTLVSSKGDGRYQKSKSLSDVTLNREPDGWKIKAIKPAS
jgi:ketosteroid isomerase-like protein